MPIPLGILAAAGFRPPTAAGSYDLLETTVLTGTQASVVFSNLGNYNTYQHLQIRYVARTNYNATGESLAIRVNGVSTSSYSQHRLFGDGSTVTSSGNASQTSFRAGFVTSATAAANAYGAGVIDLLDPYESKNKTFRSLSGALNTNIVALSSGAYLATDSVSSLTIISETANSFVSGSRFSLYGLKASA